MKNKTLQEQIDEFYKKTGFQLKVKNGRPCYDGYLNLNGTKIGELPENLVVNGNLDLYGTKITKLPENLVVGGYLDLYKTKITQLPDNLIVGGHLNLEGSKITKLPKNLIVGGWIDLYGVKVTELPENLVVGGYLNLVNTKITKLPDNLIVGGCLDLDDTDIASLPENLVVEGSLFLKYTKVTELPESLVVGHSLDFRGTQISSLPNNLVVGGIIYGITYEPRTPILTEDAKEKLKKIRDFLQWNVGGKTYIKIDGIFSVVDNHKGNVWVVHRVAEDETWYIVTDGEGHYAHGATLKEAKADLIYKINDRDTSSYEHLSLDDEVSFTEAIAMYRTITGACSAGTRDFIENRLPKPHKERYSIKEIINLTKGEFGSESLMDFFQDK